MRTLRGKKKGQSVIEYAVIIGLVTAIAIYILPHFIAWVEQLINTAGNASGIQTVPVAAPPSTARNFLIIISFVTTMGLPTVVSIVTSIWDGAIGNDPPGQVTAAKAQVPRDGQGRCKKCGASESFGRLSAKLCLSGISFEIWGITNALQNKVNLRRDLGIENHHLAITLVILIFFHIIFHYMCSKRIPDKKMMLRFLLVASSMLGPMCVFYGLTV